MSPSGTGGMSRIGMSTIWSFGKCCVVTVGTTTWLMAQGLDGKLHP